MAAPGGGAARAAPPAAAGGHVIPAPSRGPRAAAATPLGLFRLAELHHQRSRSQARRCRVRGSRGMTTIFEALEREIQQLRREIANRDRRIAELEAQIKRKGFDWEKRDANLAAR